MIFLILTFENDLRDDVVEKREEATGRGSHITLI